MGRYRVPSGHRALSDDLIARGARLAVLDREQPGALASALASGADAVIDTIAYTADHADQLLEIAPSVGSFIVISSSSVYLDPAGRTLDEARKGGFPDLPSPHKETRPRSTPVPKPTRPGRSRWSGSSWIRPGSR